MFNARVLSLGVFAYKDSINIVIRSFEAFDGNARTNIGKQFEGPSKSEVERYMTLAD
jgi:hypothetical protein